MLTQKEKIILFGSIGVTSMALSYYFRDDIKKVIKKTFGGYMWFDESLKWYRNVGTKGKVETLHPLVRDNFKEFISRVEKELGLQIIATSGYRDYAKQAALHDENPNNAEAGKSDHNFGFALDINVLNAKGQNILGKSSTKDAWIKSGVVAIAKKMGLLWGGDFEGYHDPVHFYVKTQGTTQLAQLVKQGRIDFKGYVLSKDVKLS